MNNHVAVVTAPLGPGRTATAQRIANVSSVNFDLDKGIVVVNGAQRNEFSYTPVTGVVFAISGGVTTVTIT